MSDTPSYLEARAELIQIIGRLESGGQSLEDSLALWERGEYLADVCQEWLSGAAARVDARIAAGEAADADDADDDDADSDDDGEDDPADGDTDDDPDAT